jgi:purine-nucleoside phosphorylase
MTCSRPTGTVVVIGLAGSLSEDVRVGDVVIGRRAVARAA